MLCEDEPRRIAAKYCEAAGLDYALSQLRLNQGYGELGSGMNV
jgi:hypothetical protein